MEKVLGPAGVDPPLTGARGENRTQHGALLLQEGRELLEYTTSTTSATGKKTAKKKPIPSNTAEKFLRSLIAYFEGSSGEDETRPVEGDVLNAIAKIQRMLEEQKNERDHYTVRSMTTSGQNNQNDSSISRLSYAQALASPGGTVHTHVTSIATPTAAKEIRIRVSDKAYSDSLRKKNKSSEHPSADTAPLLEW